MYNPEPARSAEHPGPSHPPISLPRYPAPAVWDDRVVWSVPAPPTSRPRLMLRSLADRVATRLARVIAAGSAAGWLAATTVFAWTLAAGHSLSALTGVQVPAELALLPIDIGILALSGGSVSSDRPSRAVRREVRRAQKAMARSQGARVTFRHRLRFLSGPLASTSLPRPLGGLLAASFWITVVVAGWQVVAAIEDLFGTGGGSLQGQRLWASMWMLHLMALGRLACRRLGASRR
jgi:hypothetical protein